MPETPLAAEVRPNGVAPFSPLLLQDCYRLRTILSKDKEILGRLDGNLPSSIREEPEADNFGLLFKAVAGERLAGFEREIVPAERMAHQRQIEFAALLALPDMS